MPSRKERRDRQKAIQSFRQAANPPPNGGERPQYTLTHVGFSGPLPHPQLLAEYERIVPGSSDRIIAVFERQVEHRFGLERQVVSGNERRADRGLVVGASIGLVGLLVAGAVAVSGHEVAGVGIAGVDLVSLVSVFVYGSRSRRDEREEKAKTLGGRRT